MTVMLESTTKRSPIMTGPVCIVCDVPMLVARVLPFEGEQELNILNVLNAGNRKARLRNSSSSGAISGR
jgi:hypothetical protein